MTRAPASEHALSVLIRGQHQDPGTPNTKAETALSPLSAKRHQELRNKRGQYFLGGPISFAWIRENIPDPVSRVVLIVRAFMDMRSSDECALTAKVWDCAGVADRYQRRRVLARLRTIRGDFDVEDRAGRPSVLRKVRVAGI